MILTGQTTPTSCSTSAAREMGIPGSNAGLMVLEEDGQVKVDALTWDSKHKELEKQITLGDLDKPAIIEAVFVKRDRPAKEWFYIPALLLLAAVIMLQLRRRRTDGEPAAA